MSPIQVLGTLYTIISLSGLLGSFIYIKLPQMIKLKERKIKLKRRKFVVTYEGMVIDNDCNIIAILPVNASPSPSEKEEKEQCTVE